MPYLLISYSVPTYLKALLLGELGLITCTQVQGQQRVAVSHTVAVNLGNTLPQGKGRQKGYFRFQRSQDVEESTEDYDIHKAQEIPGAENSRIWE